MNDMQSSERWIIGALLIVALLTFFFPLATLQVPILGTQDVSGYDLIAKAKEFNQALDAVKSKELRESGTEPSQPIPSESNATVSDSSIPLSVRTLPLIPIEIIASFTCALLALFCCLGPFGSSPTKAFSTIGGVAAVAALLHLSVANSDLHTWFREQMKADSSALANDPFAGLARQIENLAVNSVQLRPGAGLYVLAAALSLAAVLVISRVLSVSTATEATLEPYPDQSNGRARSFAFFALFLVALTVAVIVLVHKPGTGASTHDAAQPSPSGSQESDIFRWPTDGLPADIVNALSTTDLAPTAPADGTKELILGVAGQKQFIPAVNDDDCMGSGGCVWKIKDAATQRELLADSQGALHKTQKLTNGYYDLLVEDKWGLYLYEYQGEKYKNTLCYGRSNGLGSPARLTSCPAGVEPATTSNEVVPTPNQSVATENASGAPPIGVTKGQTSEEVLAILGPPISVTVGAKRVYSYPHSTVVFVDGKVSEVHQSSDNSGPGLGTTDVQKGIALPDSLTTPGSGGNVGGELYHVGGGVSAPVPLNTVEAGFSDEARRAKYQGVCLVSVIVDEQGNPKNPRVIRGLRMGLDEKALEAVRKYKFKPAMKDGRVPVPVMITVEVNFRLY